jgi:hypothetical protein
VRPEPDSLGRDLARRLRAFLQDQRFDNLRVAQAFVDEANDRFERCPFIDDLDFRLRRLRSRIGASMILDWPPPFSGGRFLP